MNKNSIKNISKESLEDIYKLNLLVTSFVFICSLFFLLLFENRKVVIIMTIKSGLYIFITSFLLTYILKYTSSFLDQRTLICKAVRYVISYIVGIALYLILWHIFASYAGILQRTNDNKWMMAYSMIAIIIVTILIMLQDYTITRRIKIETDLENSRLETNSKEAENLILKQQIQPHFLFNSLSTLKSLINIDTVKSQTYLIHLSEFLRAAISHNKSFTATLEEELAICKNYLEMQKIRFGRALDWDIIIDDKYALTGLLPCLSLQPLVENAIKHNILTVEMPLKITITQKNKNVSVSNTINKKMYVENSTKSGLANLNERYYLLSGNHICIETFEDCFSVSLDFIKNENNYY